MPLLSGLCVFYGIIRIEQVVTYLRQHLIVIIVTVSGVERTQSCGRSRSNSQ